MFHIYLALLTVCTNAQSLQEFPFDEFMGVSLNNSGVYFDSCATKWWCECPLQSNATCTHYGTCCVDYLWQIQAPSSVTDYKRMLREKVSDFTSS